MLANIDYTNLITSETFTTLFDFNSMQYDFQLSVILSALSSICAIDISTNDTRDNVYHIEQKATDKYIVVNTYIYKRKTISYTFKFTTIEDILEFIITDLCELLIEKQD